ncbi:MAG: hypothetical protein M3124_03165 [Actinomycetota bacterium]|nr:hypothetical protein [Actinomycetota bacterium]
MSSSVRVACVQLAARDVEQSERALAEAVDAASAAGSDADLVILPEATHPGYVVHEAKPWLDTEVFQRACKAFGEVASDTGCSLAVGIARPVGDSLLNSALLFDASGAIIAIADKSFLWHFDARWFDPGRPGEVVELEWGRVGMFVCADARMMEVPRRLAVAGADLLVDCTALVLGPAGVNAQIEYMLGVRAWENASFLAVANKCGFEAGIAHYAGRSAIYAPSGERLVEAPADEPTTIFATLDLDERPPLPVQRARDGYPKLTAARETLEIAAALERPAPVEPLRLALIGSPLPARATPAELGADLAIGPTIPAWDKALSVKGDQVLFGSERLSSGDIVEFGHARIGILTGDRGEVPEEMRCLMLRGASLVVWAGMEVLPSSELLRTRADENRTNLVAITAEGRWSAWSAMGAPLGTGPRAGLDAVLVEVPLAQAWHKEMAPGTDVVRGRTPEHYRELAAGGRGTGDQCL